MLADTIDFSWTLFLDRDGVINRRIMGGYVQKIEDFHFNDGVMDFLKFAHLNFHKIVVVTNQQGVGRGLMNQFDLDAIHLHMMTKVIQKKGRIDKVYTATNLKDSADNIRKPLPFMGYEAKNDFPTIDFTKSIMVGDTNSDILFGKKLGMRTVLIRSEEIVEEEADITINNLKELIF